MTYIFIILCFQLKSGQTQFTQNKIKHWDFYIHIFYILEFILFFKAESFIIYILSQFIK